MKYVEQEIEHAAFFADAVKQGQEIAQVGLGESLCDAMACGVIRFASLGEPTNTGIAFDTYHYVRWHETGVARIRLSHGLAAKLALTDPTGIDPEEVQLPFNAFCLELPHPNGPIVAQSLDDGDASRQDVPYLHVTRYYDSHDGEPVEFGRRSIAEALIHFAEEKQRRDWSKRALHIALTTRDLSRYHSRVAFAEAVHTNIDEDATTIDSSTGAIVGLAHHTQRALQMAMRIVVNLCLYLKYTDSACVSRSAGRVVNHDHGLHSLVYEIGKEVKLERSLRDAVRAFCSTGKAHEKWILEKRFIVRGHWKRQAFGEGRSERKLIFVEPYWKGPADAPVLARIHTDEPKSR